MSNCEGTDFGEDLDQSKMDENQCPIAYSDIDGYNNEEEESCAGKEQRVICNEDRPYMDERQRLILDQDKENSYAEEQHRITSDEGQTICLSGSLIGIKRENFEDIYDLYCNHALEVGFSVRRSSTKYNSKGKVVCKCLVCSCQGTRKERASSSIEGKRRATNITRSNCKASLRAKLNADGLFEVVDHTTEHNHTLSRREWSYMHLSQRSINTEHAVIFEDTISCEMRPTNSFRYMSQDAGGEDVLGHTKEDDLNS